METSMTEQGPLKQGARKVAKSRDGDRQRRQGDNRTPDKTIGQVKYADNEGGNEQDRQGGSTRTTSEDQDGVGEP
jgi:hypothetical protein